VIRHYTCVLYNATPSSEIYTLSLHDALPIFGRGRQVEHMVAAGAALAVQLIDPLFETREPGLVVELCRHVIYALGEGIPDQGRRSEEHTSELQSHLNLVCRLLLEKKNEQYHK